VVLKKQHSIIILDMESREIRDRFLNFFKNKGHTVLPVSSIISTDETVLFTTAGMQQFKNYYIYPNDAPAAAVVTIQPCIRTSDINEVGDKTHLTFFEMLGNFSFGYPSREGSYFKKEAIEMAWEFLTKELKIDKNRIHATYFKGEKDIKEDKESLEILKNFEGLTKIVPEGIEETFWSLGTEGSPGGPTVEFYVDGIEVWNLVFNEYILRNGKYEVSEFKGVDTGMGLERLCSVLQGKEDVFETDLLEPIIKELENISELKYKYKQKEFRIIADHVKASCFLIKESILPDKEDRGYVLRRLLRESMLAARKINLKEKWYVELVKKVNECSDIKPSWHIKITDNVIITVIQHEEERFKKALDQGIKEFNKLTEGQKILSGAITFKLVSTYGFPIELVREIASEQGIIVNERQLEEELKKHQKISRAGAEKKFKGGLADQEEETIKLHTAAHLLLQALREILGDHVVQKGSNITAERLRFDFSHSEKLTEEQIKQVEELVNKKIKEKLPVSVEEITVEEAKKQGAMGVFEERYGDKVKVYKIGDFSKEICGGPHVKNTSELGQFKIKKEESVGAGIRRIKAELKLV
jgi:alanyl-tRNA synthetase